METSSRWRQFVLPQPLWGQLPSSLSFPAQSRSSSKISPLPVPYCRPIKRPLRLQYVHSHISAQLGQLYITTMNPSCWNAPIKTIRWVTSMFMFCTLNFCSDLLLLAPLLHNNSPRNADIWLLRQSLFAYHNANILWEALIQLRSPEFPICFTSVTIVDESTGITDVVRRVQSIGWQYLPKSQLKTGNWCINIIEVVITDCSPNTIVVDFEPSFAVLITACQSDLRVWKQQRQRHRC